MRYDLCCLVAQNYHNIATDTNNSLITLAECWLSKLIFQLIFFNGKKLAYQNFKIVLSEACVRLDKFCDLALPYGCY